MGHPVQVAGLVVLLALLAGCGGSVADLDRTVERRTEAASDPFCAAVAANSSAIRPLSGLLARGSGPTPELTGLAAEVRRTNADLVATAPGELRSDVERSVAGSTVQLDALESGGAAAARSPEVVAAVEDPEFTAAGDRIRQYVQQNC
jgi:hypothetical protein